MASFVKTYKGEILAIYFVAAMILPNILLDITETMPLLAKIVNIVLPLSLYILLTGLVRSIGKGVLWTFLLVVFNAFEIVIFYLFSGSIVAIDMYLNVVTTTPSEATLLLMNLAVPMAFVIVVYLGMLAWAGVAVKKHHETGETYRRYAKRIGFIGTIIGVSLLIFGQLTNPRFKTSRNIFPINVISNFVNAFPRYYQSVNYHRTSADFSYESVDTHELPDSLREVHVVIIGETCRANNWQLAGYERETNPRLSQRDDIHFFGRTISQSNTTHKCVPMLLSPIEASNFDSIVRIKSVVTAFKEAGYRTAFFTTQPKNGSYNQFFGEEADHHEFLLWEDYNDGRLVELLKEEVASTDAQKLFVVLHTYGSHFRYQDRYPAEMEHFKPTDASDAKRQNRHQLINAYDNSLRFTDYLLNDVMTYLDSIGVVGSVIFSPDHGEDIFDDDRERFLHASPTPTYYQLYVPVLVWTSDAYDELYPEIAATLEDNRMKFLTAPQALFHTTVEIGGISTPLFNPTKSLANSRYVEPAALYLNDYNEAIPLEESGLKPIDIQFINPFLP